MRTRTAVHSRELFGGLLLPLFDQEGKFEGRCDWVFVQAVLFMVTARLIYFYLYPSANGRRLRCRRVLTMSNDRMTNQWASLSRRGLFHLPYHQPLYAGIRPEVWHYLHMISFETCLFNNAGNIYNNHSYDRNP